MEIRDKLFGLLAALVIVGVVTNVVIIHTGQQQVRTVIEPGSLDIAEQTMYSIREQLDHDARYQQAYAVTQASSPVLQDANQEPFSRAQLQERDAAWMDGNTSLEAAATQNTLAEDLRQYQSSLNRKNDEYGWFSELIVADRFGRLVAATNRTTDYNQRDEQWWQVARNESLYIDDTGLDRSSGVMSVTIAAPIYNENSAVTGVLKAVQDIENLGGFLTQLTLERQVIDHMYILHEDAAVLWADNTTNIGGPLATDGQPMPETGTFQMQSPVDGEDTLFAVSPGNGVPSTEHIDMRLLVEYDDTSWQRIRTVFWWTPAVALLLFVILGVSVIAAIYHWVYQPMSSLTTSLEQLSQGQKDVQIDDTLLARNDEIGQLAQAFNRLLISIKLAMKRE